MKKNINLFLIIFLSLISFCLLVNVSQAALVPCGTSTTPACTWCHLMLLGKNIIDFLMYLVFPLAAVMIVIGGITIMTAAGSPAKVVNGRKIIMSAVVGILIALLSWLIIDTIIKILATGWGNLKIGPWNSFGC